MPGDDHRKLDQSAWARKIGVAFAASRNSGVTQMDGKMLGKPHLRLALG